MTSGSRTADAREERGEGDVPAHAQRVDHRAATRCTCTKRSVHLATEAPPVPSILHVASAL